MAADWSSMSQDLVVKLIGSTILPGDCIRMGTVCRAWYKALVECCERNIVMYHRRLTLLGVPESNGGDLISQRGAASLCNFRDQYTINFPDFNMHNQLIVGAIGGYVVIADEMSQLYCYNPMAGWGSMFLLPPVTTLPMVNPFRNSDGNLVHYVYGTPRFDPQQILPNELRYRYRKVVLLWDLERRHLATRIPFDGIKWNAVLILEGERMVAFADPEATRWTVVTLDHGWDFPPEDAAAFDCLLCTLHSDGVVNLWCFTYNLPTIFRTLPSNYHIPPDLAWESIWTNEVIGFGYLVVSGQDLLQVQRLRCHNDPAERTKFFVVYQWRPNESRWDFIFDIGDKALVLGLNYSMCLPIDEHPGLRRNCVYFLEDRGHIRLGYNAQLGTLLRDMGIFNISTGMIESRASPVGNISLTPKPVWFMPSLLTAQ